MQVLGGSTVQVTADFYNANPFFDNSGGEIRYARKVYMLEFYSTGVLFHSARFMPLSEDDPRNPRHDPRYRQVPDAELPRTESLKDTIERIMPYWHCVIFPTLAVADQIIVAAHGNSLRGIIKHLKGISDQDIVSLNLPTAVPYVFEFDDNLRLQKDYFLGDPEEIKRLMEAVANQGKKK